jgi:hypothetical protein
VSSTIAASPATLSTEAPAAPSGPRTAETTPPTVSERAAQGAPSPDDEESSTATFDPAPLAPPSGPSTVEPPPPKIPAVGPLSAPAAPLAVPVGSAIPLIPPKLVPIDQAEPQQSGEQPYVPLENIRLPEPVQQPVPAAPPTESRQASLPPEAVPPEPGLPPQQAPLEAIPLRAEPAPSLQRPAVTRQPIGGRYGQPAWMTPRASTSKSHAGSPTVVFSNRPRPAAARGPILPVSAALPSTTDVRR